MRSVYTPAAGFAMLAVSLVTLGGCSSAPKDPLSAAQLGEIHQGFSAALEPMIRAANRDQLDGSIEMKVVIDSDDQLLECKGKPVTGAPGLVEVVERACWTTLFPPLPRQAFAKDDRARFRMPITVEMNLGQDTPQFAYYQAVVFPMFAQNQYFWDNGVSGLVIGSVGEASFRYVADREGRVLSCTVRIEPTETRPKAFSRSPSLAANLEKVCMKMNLARMPGFVVAPNGLATGTVWTTYSPWRKRAPRAAAW